MKSLGNLMGRIALIGAGVLVPLLLLDVAVRIMGLAPPAEPNPAIWEPHPLFGWWHVPYSGGTFYSDYTEFEAEVRINARSLRDREIGYDNPNGAFRVLSLADSFGEALQVDLEETYHKRLESQLAQSMGRPVEVLNAGVGGWGTDQEAVFYLAEGFRYQPDVVLLAFFVRNDAVNNFGPLEIERNGGVQQKQFFTLSPAGELIPPPLETGDATEISAQVAPSKKPALIGAADTLWQYSALYRFMVPYLRDVPAVVQQLGPSGILGGEAVVRANHPTTPIPFFVYRKPADEQFEAAWQLTEAIIAALRDEVESRGAQLAVVLIGAPEQLYAEEWEKTVAGHPEMQSYDWDLEAPNRRLTRFLSKEQIAHLDLLPLFRQAAQTPDTPPLHFQHDQHWTPAGHKLAADAIHNFLTTEAGLSINSEQ